MIGNLILIAYSLLSGAGSAALWTKGSVQLPNQDNVPLSAAQQAVLAFFLACHTALAVIAVCRWSFKVHPAIGVGAIVLILLSRALNGRIIYGRNRWSHYAIVGLLLSVAWYFG